MGTCVSDIIHDCECLHPLERVIVVRVPPLEVVSLFGSCAFVLSLSLSLLPSYSCKIFPCYQLNESLISCLVPRHTILIFL